MARSFYHAIEEGLVDPRRMIQIGIRSPVDREICDWTIGKGVTIVTAEEVHEAGPKPSPSASATWSARARPI